MKNQTRKKVILWLATLVLLVTSCATAFASPGDRTIKHSSSMSWGMGENIQSVFRMGDGFGVISSDDTGMYLLKYADAQSEPEKFVLQEYNYDPFAEEEGAEEAQMTGEAPEGTEPEADEPADEAEIQFEAKPETADPAAENGAAAEEKQEDAEAVAGEQPAVEGLLSLDDIDWSDEALNDEQAQDAFPEGAYFSGDGEFPEGMDFQYEPETYYNTQNWFVWNGEVYGIAVGQKWDENGNSTLEGVKVKHYKLEDGQVTEEDTDLPEWDHETLAGEMDSFGSFYLNDVSVAGDTLLAQTWGATGTIIMTVDLKTGAVSTLDMGEKNVNAYTAGPEGSVLVGVYDWQSEKCSIVRKNLSDGKEETLTEFENTTEDMGLCYEADTDMLYMAQGGELWKAPMADLTKLEAVNDCPLTGCKITALPNGFVLAWNNYNILLRNTDPSVRGTTMLHVEDNTGYNRTMSETVFALNEKRGDLSVIIRQQYSWSAQTHALTDMMNKDGSTDIYVLPYEGTEFNALKKRGYLADLSDNAEIAEKVNRMYPYIQDALKQDGKIIAVPIGLTGYSFGLNYTAWKKIGGTEEELPKTWEQFFDWLEKLPERIEGAEATLTDNPYAADSLSGTFTSDIMYQYQMWLDKKGEGLVFNTPELSSLLKRANNIDYKSLGLQSWDDDIHGYTIEGNHILATSMQAPMGYEGMQNEMPLPLSLKEGEDPIIPVQIYVACVNPFSEHAAEAKEFLALAMENLEYNANYSFFADQTEPLRAPYYEQNKKNYEKWLAEAQKEYEKAEEGEAKIWAEQSVKSWEESLEQLDQESWIISPDKLRIYQNILPFCKVLDHDYQREVQATISGQEAQLEAQLMDGEDGDSINIDNFLNLLDQKMQMIRDEGK